MHDPRHRQAPLEPGQTLMVRGRRYVIDALRTGRNGETQVQATWRGDRLIETVLWRYNDVWARVATDSTD